MQFKSNIDKLTEDFNQLNSEEINQRNKYSEYKPEAVDGKVKSWRIEKSNEIISRAKGLSRDIEKQVNVELVKPLKIKYPLRSSVSTSEKTLGEMQRANAFEFLKSVENKNAIVKEINISLSNNDLDYANTLIDLIETNKPDQVKLSSEPKEKQDFYRTVTSIKSEFEGKYKLTESNSMLSELSKNKNEVDFIIQAIEENDSLIILPRQFELIPQRDRMKYTQAATKSMMFLQKRNSL